MWRCFVGFGVPIALDSYRDGVFFPLIGTSCGKKVNANKSGRQKDKKGER